MLSRSLREVYWKLEKLIVPELTTSQYLYRNTLFASVPNHKFCWLDLGCGHQVFTDWMTADEQRMIAKTQFAVGVDQDVPSLKAHNGLDFKICADISVVPIKDSAFDVVSANMVVEHVIDPDKVLREVQRLLCPGGVFIFHTTNSSNPMLWAASKVPERIKLRLIYLLEGRKPEDVFPTCYKINTPQQVREVAARVGLAVERIDLVSTSAITQLITPLAILELLFIRLLRKPGLQHLRTNMICVLKKPAYSDPARAASCG
jgi:SAM-dependent methyltransferase